MPTAYRSPTPIAMATNIRSVDVRFAASGALLRNAPRTARLLSTKLEGAVEALDSQWISGWARDAANPERALQVEVFVDGARLGRFATGEPNALCAANGWAQTAVFASRCPRPAGTAPSTRSTCAFCR
ncbi:MAG: hypothetical protein AcusKO_44370 [Acuticoccus sp.]